MPHKPRFHALGPIVCLRVRHLYLNMAYVWSTKLRVFPGFQLKRGWQYDYLMLWEFPIFLPHFISLHFVFKRGDVCPPNKQAD